MRLLLDTHTFIWYVTDDPKLSNTAKQLINEGSNDVLLSKASIWEMAIKHSTGKLNFETSFDLFVEQQVRLNAIEVLNIEINHLTAVATLPLYHRDPFDRLLIAQAIVEKLPIVGADAAFDAYAVQRLW